MKLSKITVLLCFVLCRIPVRCRGCSPRRRCSRPGRTPRYPRGSRQLKKGKFTDIDSPPSSFLPSCMYIHHAIHKPLSYINIHVVHRWYALHRFQKVTLIYLQVCRHHAIHKPLSYMNIHVVHRRYAIHRFQKVDHTYLHEYILYAI